MDKKILIYGMGKTGKAVKKFCENNKIKYFTFDDNIDKRNRFDKLIKNMNEQLKKQKKPSRSKKKYCQVVLIIFASDLKNNFNMRICFKLGGIGKSPGRLSERRD